MKTHDTFPGRSYSVHTTTGCTVSDDTGWSKKLAAPEDYFTAHGGKVYLSDASASVKEVFKPVLVISGGGNSGGNAGDWYGILKLELDALLGAGNYKLDYHWEGDTAVLSCLLSLNASSEQVKDAERLLRRCAPGAVRVAMADVPLGFARLAYLGTNAYSPIDTGITVSSDTGARVVALVEGDPNTNYTALAGVEKQFLVAGVNPSTKMVSWAWGTPDTQASYTTLLTGETILTADISSYPGKLLKYGGGFFTASLNYENNGEWRYSEGQQSVVGLLPAPDALSTKPVTLFARNESSVGNMSSYSWRGRIYKAQFSEGTRVVRNFVPVVNDAGMPCMFDTVSRSQFFGGDGFICGIEAQDQLDALLRGLPNLTGQDGKELYLRIYTPIYESAVASGIIEATATAKNWQIAYDPTTVTAATAV